GYTSGVPQPLSGGFGNWTTANRRQTGAVYQSQPCADARIGRRVCGGGREGGRSDTDGHLEGQQPLRCHQSESAGLGDCDGQCTVVVTHPLMGPSSTDTVSAI